MAYNFYRVPKYYVGQFDEMPVFKVFDRMLLFGGAVVQVYLQHGPQVYGGLPLLTYVKLFLSTSLILLGCFISEDQLREKNIREMLQDRHFREA